MKLSKSSKARIKRMTVKERRELFKAAILMADSELISAGKYSAIAREVGKLN